MDKYYNKSKEFFEYQKQHNKTKEIHKIFYTILKNYPKSEISIIDKDYKKFSELYDLYVLKDARFNDSFENLVSLFADFNKNNKIIDIRQDKPLNNANECVNCLLEVFSQRRDIEFIYSRKENYCIRYETNDAEYIINFTNIGFI